MRSIRKQGNCFGGIYVRGNITSSFAAAAGRWFGYIDEISSAPRESERVRTIVLVIFLDVVSKT